LVPKGAWDNNLRSYLTGAQWDKVRRKCYAEADNKCEICGGQDPVRLAKGHSPVDCHEKWEFNDGIVKLVGLISLCPDCHRVKHIGLAGARGQFHLALDHFMKVNKLNKVDAMHHIKDASRLWAKRNEKEWDLDIDYLEVYMGEKLKGKKPKKMVDDAGEAF
jgi:hypothetical protein